jgi:hypothetical protein
MKMISLRLVGVFHAGLDRFDARWQKFCLKGNIVKTKVLSATGIASTSVLSILLGVAVHVYAQQDQHGDKQNQPKQEQQHSQPPQQQHSEQPQQQHAQQPQQQQHAQQPQQQQPQQQHAQQPQQQQHAQQPQQQQPQQQHAQQQQQHSQQQEQLRAQQQQPQQQHAQQQQLSSQSRTQEQQRVVQSGWQQHSAQNWQTDHRSWQQRGGYSGYRVPDDRYRGYFGSQHGFRIYGLPFLVVGGNPRFQYEGYWISLIDPWPGSWANNWYDTDDVYVSYVNNGYYMYNRRYPGIGIAVSISM